MDTAPVPHDLEAEKAILGALLAQPDRLADVAELVAAGDFFRVAHQTVFAAIVAAAEQRKAIDLITIKDALGPARLEDVGGIGYLAGLVDVGRGANVAHYCRIVKDKAIRRALQAVASQAIQDAGSAEVQAASALERAEAALYKLGTAQQIGDLMPAAAVVAETYPILEKIINSGGKTTGIATGFPDLDRMTRGLQPGNLILLAGRPAMGKTAFALNLADAVALGGQRLTVDFFSLEMARTELMIRLLSARGRIDAHRLLSGRPSEKDYGRLSHAFGEYSEAPLFIDDTASTTVAAIRGKLRRAKARRGLGLVVIDYLQLLSSDRRFENRNVEVSAMSRGLKILAKELEVPIIALSQLSRDVERRGAEARPRLSDLRESGSLEQDADVVAFVHRPIVYDAQADPMAAELILAKQRNGPTGIIDLRWSAECTRFDSVAGEDGGRLVQGAA